MSGITVMITAKEAKAIGKKIGVTLEKLREFGSYPKLPTGARITGGAGKYWLISYHSDLRDVREYVPVDDGRKIYVPERNW